MVAEKNYHPIETGDVKKTAADISELEKWIKCKPIILISHGVEMFLSGSKNLFL